MIKNERAITLVRLVFIIIILVIIIGVGFWKYNQDKGEEKLNLTDNTNTLNTANENKLASEQIEVNLEEWRKKLWDYFVDYEKCFSVRLENNNGKNEIDDNNFLVKKGYDLAIIQDKVSDEGEVSKKDLDEILLKYYGKVPKDYNTDIYEYDSEKEIIRLKENSGYDNHGTNALFLKQISFDGKEYTADFENYIIPESFDENFDNGVYSEFLSFETNNETTTINFDYDKMYNSLVKSNLKYQKIRGRDIRIKFEEKENGIYQINWLSSTN